MTAWVNERSTSLDVYGFPTLNSSRQCYLISKEATLSVALLLGLEPVRVALGAGVDEGRALGFLRVVKPVWNSLLASS